MTIKRKWVQYGAVLGIGFIVYSTGFLTEISAFAQRGLLATGLLNPDLNGREQLSNTHTDAQTQPVVPKANFSFELRSSDGVLTNLKAFEGKVIFLNFWATWCPPCIAEMPGINNLHKEMGDEVAFIMLSFDTDFETAKNYIKRKGFNLPIYSPVSAIPSVFSANGLPTTYVIDANGDIVMTHQGMADYDNREFRDFLKSLK